MARGRSVWSAFVAANVFLAFAGAGSTSVGVGCDGSGGHAVNVGDGANYLNGVSVRSACDAWAVGGFERGRKSQTLVEHWDGTRWRHVESPNPGGRSRNDDLAGVTALSAQNAWAVGSFSNGQARQTLVEHWNGSDWKVSKSPESRRPSPYRSIAGGGCELWLERLGGGLLRGAFGGRTPVARPPLERVGVEAGAKSEPRPQQRERAQRRQPRFRRRTFGPSATTRSSRAASTHLALGRLGLDALPDP